MNWVKRKLLAIWEFLCNAVWWVRSKIIFFSLRLFFLFFRNNCLNRSYEREKPLPYYPPSYTRGQDGEEDDDKEDESSSDIAIVPIVSSRRRVETDNVAVAYRRIPVVEEDDNEDKEHSSPSLDSSIDVEEGDEILYRRFLEEQKENDRIFIFEGVKAYQIPRRISNQSTPRIASSAEASVGASSEDMSVLEQLDGDVVARYE